MPERTIDIALDDKRAAQLKRYAQMHGMTESEAVNELASGELRRRTSPRACRGTVQPFRRR